MRPEPTKPRARSTSPYEELYRSRSDFILWGRRPGRLLVNVNQYARHGRVLDAGCGDGKNALYLEQQGFQVYGVDSSSLAIQGLRNRFATANWDARGQYEVLDVQDLIVSEPFDMLISYGLFHCLAVDVRVDVHRRLQASVRPGGVMVFCCLTNTVPMPPDHGTGDVVLPDHSEVIGLLDGWRTEHLEDGLFEEEHEPVIGFHKHSAVWAIARRIG